ncbi:hypothetical protein QTP70_025308 [Hemibagrus guttatus]|uniref:Ig-like domain-containing protein n=1 Tax=Hemibagrus guttatus TaxID=175788 RepID=A0AAE0PXW1_9TELE|nr:hypothetical protein QTP70_025308 [Hemibagrus guttatus]
MRIIQLQFYLLVYCGAAESLTEKSVDLGENVTLKCEVSIRDVSWFLIKPSKALFLLRSYSSKTVDAHYGNATNKKRFSLQYNSSLFIHNISTNELGVYFCIHAQPGSDPDISSGIRLYVQNHSADNRESDIKQPKNQTADKDELLSNNVIVFGTAACLVMLSVTDLLVYCGAAESLTEESVDLGENVTLKCEVSIRDVSWFLIKPSEALFLLRSYSSKTVDADYGNATNKKRFSLQYNGSLFIHNISTNELGVYFCIHAQPGSDPDISSGIRLYVQNHSAGNQSKITDDKQLQNQTTRESDVISPWSASFIVSVIMNCALALVVTGPEPVTQSDHGQNGDLTQLTWTLFAVSSNP